MLRKYYNPNDQKADPRIEIPECKKPENKHLDSKVIKACLGPKQHPVNPHAQRLLTAEARGATKVPKQPSKAEKAEKKRKTDKQKEVESGVSRIGFLFQNGGFRLRS